MTAPQSTEKRCNHSELRRAKTGGWFCADGDCGFSIPELASPSSKTETLVAWLREQASTFIPQGEFERNLLAAADALDASRVETPARRFSARCLIEKLHGYVTGVMDRKGYSETLQEIERLLAKCEHGATTEEVCPECLGAPSDNPDEEARAAVKTSRDDVSGDSK